jgi:hypothetical protein
VRDKIIFKGSSHTIGYGLDIELSSRYNDNNWLTENGIILPRPDGFIDEDWYHINTNRWPKKVCDRLGKVEHDFNNIDRLKKTPLSDFMLELSITPKQLLSDVDVIIYEPQITRFFHNDVQFTPAEMLKKINDSNVLDSEKQILYDWLDNHDEYIENSLKLMELCIEKHNEIKFLFFYFFGHSYYLDEKIKKYPTIEERIIEFTINEETSTNLYSLLTKNKLRVCDTAYCYTHRVDEFGNERWKVGDYVDEHAGVLAQEMIAKSVIKHITQKGD